MERIDKPCSRLLQLLSITGDRQTDMVRKTGIEKSAISNYLNGKRIPRQDKLYTISVAYGVNPAWLMGLDVEMYIKNEDEEQNRILTYAKRISQLSEENRKILENQIELMEKVESLEKKK